MNIKIGGKWMFIHPQIEPLVMPHGLLKPGFPSASPCQSACGIPGTGGLPGLGQQIASLLPQDRRHRLRVALARLALELLLSQSKSGISMVYPEPCKEFRRQSQSKPGNKMVVIPEQCFKDQEGG